MLPWTPVCSLGRKAAASLQREMQSTVNYLWHTDDLLGQGATASVYKARNKVGARPEVSPQWVSGLGLSGQAPLICSV